MRASGLQYGPFERRWEQVATILHRALRPHGDNWAVAARGYRPDTAHLRRATWQLAPRPEWITTPHVAWLVPATAQRHTLQSGVRHVDAVILDLDDTFAPSHTNLERAHTLFAELAEHPLPLPVGVRVRPVWLRDPRVTVAGEPAVAAAVDAAAVLVQLASRQPCFLCLPKVTTFEEAAAWESALAESEALLGLRRGTVPAVVQLELLPALFQAEEIVWALRERVFAVAAGRWDYVASAIRHLGDQPGRCIPPPDALTTSDPFLSASFHALAQLARRRGAVAAGSVVSRPFGDALDRVLGEKRWEAALGFQACWVSDPAWGPFVREALRTVAGLEPQSSDEDDLAQQLVSVPSWPAVPLTAVERTLSLLACFLEAWQQGHGTAACGNGTEDLSTAEARRAALWHWLRQAVPLDDGRRLTPALYRTVRDTLVSAETAPLLDALVCEPRLSRPLPAVVSPASQRVGEQPPAREQTTEE